MILSKFLANNQAYVTKLYICGVLFCLMIKMIINDHLFMLYYIFCGKTSNKKYIVAVVGSHLSVGRLVHQSAGRRDLYVLFLDCHWLDFNETLQYQAYIWNVRSDFDFTKSFVILNTYILWHSRIKEYW